MLRGSEVPSVQQSGLGPPEAKGKKTRFLMNTEGCSFGSQAVSQVIGCLTAPV